MTRAEMVRIGSAMSERVVQLIGGPYKHDTFETEFEELQKILGVSNDVKIVFADSNRRGYYPLPGEHFVITRGLLASLEDANAVNSLFNSFKSQAIKADTILTSQSMWSATQDALASSGSEVNLNSGVMVLSRKYLDYLCDHTCFLHKPSFQSEVKFQMPSSLLEIKQLQVAYDLMEIGKNFERDDKLHDAIKTYFEAVMLASEQPKILTTIGLAYLRAGDYQTARLHLQEAVRIEPEYFATRMGLGYIHLIEGEFLLAQQQLKKSVDLLPAVENLFLLAQAKENLNQLTEARKLYLMVSENDDTNRLGKMANERLKILNQKK